MSNKHNFGSSQHPQKCAGFTLPKSEQEFWIAQLWLLLSALTRKPPLLHWNGHICRSGSEAEIVFLPPWQRVIVLLGPFLVMSFLSAWNQSLLLKTDFWAVMQCHRWHREKAQSGARLGEGTRGSFGPAESRKSKEYHMSGIRKWLHNGSSLFSFPSPSLPLSFCFCSIWVPWCLSYYMSSSSKLFDQVAWRTTHSRRIINVSMCLPLCIVFCLLKRINDPIMKLAVKWLIHFSNLEKKPIGRELLNKHNGLCFYPPC